MTDKPASEPQASVTPRYVTGYGYAPHTKISDGANGYVEVCECTTLERAKFVVAALNQAETLAAQAGGREAALLQKCLKAFAEIDANIARCMFSEARSMAGNVGLELEAVLSQLAPAATPSATIKATLIPAGPLKMAPITEDDLAGSPPARPGGEGTRVS